MKRNVVAIGLATLVLGCGVTPRTHPNDGVVRVAITTIPTSLDPAKSTTLVTTELARQQFENLVSIDREAVLHPQLADTWNIANDGKTYTFHLRDAKFSDGTVLTPSVAKSSLERACSAEVGSAEVFLYLGDIAGATEMRQPQAKGIAGIQANDKSRTLTFRLVRRTPSFLSKLTHPVASIVHSTAKGLAGTGPYVLASQEIGNSYNFEPNRNFSGSVSNRGLKILVVSDSSTRINLFRTGALDICPIGLGDSVAIDNDETLSKQLRRTPTAAVAFLQFNSSTLPELDNVDLRTALCLSLDRPRLIRTILHGVPALANDLIPPGVTGHAFGSMVPPYELGQARLLLAKLKTLPKLSIYYGDRDRLSAVAEWIAGEWSKSLGIEAKTEYRPSGELLAMNQKGQVPIYLTGWNGDYSDPENFIRSILYSSSTTNGSKFRSAAVDHFIDVADETSDVNERIKQYATAERMALAAVPVFPLFHQCELELISNRLNQWPSGAFGWGALNEVKILR